MDPVQLAILIFFLIGSAFFSGMETGIISVNKLRLAHLVRRGSKAAKRVQYFIDRPEDFLGTTLIGTNLCNSGFNIIMGSILALVAGRYSEMVNFLVVAPTVLIFGEYLPKAYFQSNPATRSLRYAPLLQISAILFWLPTKLVGLLSRILVPSPKGVNIDEAYSLTRDELRRLTSPEGSAQTLISAQKEQLIEGVFKLSEMKASDLMVPRDQMVCINSRSSSEEIVDVARNYATSRFPVYDAETQNFTGVIHIMDVLEHRRTHESLSHFLRPPQFVAENATADELIPRMQLTRQPLLMVQNDHGEVVGMVTMQRLLSEVVGPVY